MLDSERKVNQFLMQYCRMLVADPATLSPLFARGAGREAVPEQQPLPPVRPPQVRVVGRYRVLLSLPGANDERVVGLDGDHPPELLYRVGVEVAVGCGLNVPGVGSGVQGTLLLSVQHHVTGPKTGRHAALPSLL
jgi:hypothetical protein